VTATSDGPGTARDTGGQRPTADRRIERVAVVGAGLVGGSVAAALRDLGIEVVLTDRDTDVRARAEAAGLADRVADDLTDAVADVDLVVAAVPAAVAASVLTAIARAAPLTALLTDVASLKGELVPAVVAALGAADLAPCRYVGGHPMAGSERTGPEAADAYLFQGATWVLTPTATTDPAALTALSGLLGRLGARVLALPPGRHDQLVAVVSHLPQVAASVLADVAADAATTAGEAVLAVAGGGFRDTTRIAASDPDLWLGILRGNRPAVLDALTAFRRRLDELHVALGAGAWDAVHALLSRASVARRGLVREGTVPAAADLVVALDDRPGSLAAATTALGQAGVNVEDLAMRHATAGDRGALLVRVDADASDRAIVALSAVGLHAHVEPRPGGDRERPDGDGARPGGDRS
jgi:prephenate dehydrogenase